MPDPVLFVKAMTAAGLACALLVTACVAWKRPAGATRSAVAHVLGTALAIIVGGRLLGLAPHWPPSDALDRLLFLVLPASMLIELIAAISKTPRWAAWLLRMCLAAVAGRVLLHGSSYLEGSVTGWTVGQVRSALVVCALVQLVVWWLLSRLIERSGGISVPLVLAQVSVAAGMALMLSGYATSGKAALPLAAGLVAMAVASWGLKVAPPGATIVGLGITGLFGILMLGRFFGELSTARALVIFVTPLAAWVSQWPALRARKPWVTGVARLVLAAIPLAAVLFLAQRDFAHNLEAPTGGEYQSDEY